MKVREIRGGKDHQFGGSWTEQKLNVLGRYLQSYTTALQNKPSRKHPFCKAFIDAFAGTGYRRNRSDADLTASPSLWLPDLAEQEPQGLLDGSAQIALKTKPEFDRYIFIESSPKRCAQLDKLKEDFPQQANSITVKRGDANECIQDLCGKSKNWRSHRAVLFLDPYGMQVEWETIQAVASTNAIDLWLLFPLGIGVNRLLKRNGDIPQAWRHRLDRLLGTQDWYDELYKVETTPTLFNYEQEHLIKATTQTIGRYFNNRLKEIFAGVVEEPGILKNSVNNPLYLLCFAVGNDRGKEVALPIAEHLLRNMR